MTDDDLDRDLDRLVEGLPEPLRKDWCVVPRRFLTQVFLVGLLFGGSTALVVSSHVLDIDGLKWAWPVVVITLVLVARWVPWWRGDRFEAQLRSSRPDDAPPRT